MWIVHYLLIVLCNSLHLDVCPTKPAYCIGPTCGVQIGGLKLRPGCTCTPEDYTHTTTQCDDTTRTRDIIFYWRPPATCRGGVDLPAPIIGVPCDLNCGEGRYLNYNMSAEDQSECDNCCLGMGQCDDLSDLTGSCCPADSTCCSSDQTDNQGTFKCCHFGTVCSNGDCVDVNLDPEESRMLRCEECPPGRSSLGGGMNYGPPWLAVPPQFSVECQSKTQGPCYPWAPDESGQYLMSGDNRDVDSSTSVLRLELETVKPGQILFAYKYDAEEIYDVFSFRLDSVAVLTVAHVVSEWQWFNKSLDIGQHTFEWVYEKDSSTSKGQDKAFLKSIQIVGFVSNDLQCDLCPPGRFMGDYAAKECTACPAGRHSSEFGATECSPCRDWEKSTGGAASCSPDLSCTVWDTYEVKSACVNGQRNISAAWLQPSLCAMQDKAQHGEATVGINFHTNGTVNVSVNFFVPFTTVPRVFDLEPKQETFVFSVGKRWDEFDVWASNVTTTGFTLEVARVNSTEGTWGQNLKVFWSAESNQGYALPKPFTEPCTVDACPQGKSRNASGVCEYCPSRTVGSNQGTCVDCTQPGFGAAAFVSTVESFLGCGHGRCGDWTFETNCQGDCGTPGWRFAADFADSGVGHNPGATSRLFLDVSHTPEARIVELQFEVMLSCPMMTGRLLVLLDEEELGRFECSGCDTDSTPIRLSILREARQGDRSDHRLAWVYTKLQDAPSSHDCDGVRIANISIVSDYAPVARTHFSGATECQPCRPGYAGANGICEQCIPGAFSPLQGSHTCTTCESGKFSYKRGSSVCLDCGVGQISNMFKNGCSQNCRLQSPDTGFQYDIATLKSPPVQISQEIDNENFTALIFVSPCQAFHATTVSRGTLPPSIGTDRREPKLPLAEMAPSECGRLSEIALIDEDDEVDNNNLAIPAHVCVVLSDGRVFSGGGIMNIQIAPLEVPEASFRLTYAGGIVATALNPSTCTSYQNAVTSISFICDLAAGVGQLQQDPSIPADMKCGSYHLVWRSSHACHICTKDDMNAVDSACLASGFRNRTYFFNQPQTCLNMGNLPQDVQIPCDPTAGLTETHFVLSRVLGFALLGVLLALVLAIVGLEIRHRMLYSKYRSLNVEVQLTDGARVFNFNESDLPASAVDDAKRDELSSDSGEEN